uniref:Uncharacterized protein n=1 Tax=Oryza rufipogon TaxID=4529 RepID=A0A0E0R522_ORYRU
MVRLTVSAQSVQREYNNQTSGGDRRQQRIKRASHGISQTLVLLELTADAAMAARRSISNGMRTATVDFLELRCYFDYFNISTITGGLEKGVLSSDPSSAVSRETNNASQATLTAASRRAAPTVGEGAGLLPRRRHRAYAWAVWARSARPRRTRRLALPVETSERAHCIDLVFVIIIVMRDSETATTSNPHLPGSCRSPYELIPTMPGCHPLYLAVIPSTYDARPELDAIGRPPASIAPKIRTIAFAWRPRPWWRAGPTTDTSRRGDSPPPLPSS